MPFSCPNKTYKTNPEQTSTDWELLVDKTGSEDAAYKLYTENNFDMPSFSGVFLEETISENDIINYNNINYRANVSEQRRLSGEQILSMQEDNASPEPYEAADKNYDLSPINVETNEISADIAEPIFGIPFSKLTKDGYTIVKRGEIEDDLMFQRDREGNVIQVETEQEALDYLKQEGLVNKIQFQNKWLVRRTEGKPMDKYSRNVQGENIARIREVNDYVRRKYGVTEDIYELKEFGKAYEVKINKRVIDKVNTGRQATLMLSSKSKEKANLELDQKIKAFLRIIGVDIKTLDAIKNADGTPMNITAKANLLTRVIEVAHGRASIDTLPEEAAHFFVALLGKDHPLYKQLMNGIENTPEYKRVLEEYKDYKEYQNDDSSLKLDLIADEAAGQMIATEIVNYHKEATNREEEGRKNLFQRIWNTIKSWFIKVEVDKAIEYLTPYQEVAKAILELNVDSLTLNSEIYGVMFQRIPLGSTYSEVIAKFASDHNAFERVLTKNEKLPKGVQQDPSGETLRYYRKSDGVMVPYSVTDAVHKIFMKYKSYALAKHLNETNDNKIKRETGTMFHALMYTLALKLIQEDTSGLLDADAIFKARGIDKITQTDAQLLELGGSELGVNINQLASLKAVVKNILNKVKEEQTKINEQTGLNGKVAILPEQFVVNSNENTGGTIDLLVVFSDTTKSLYDYKFMSPTARYTKYNYETGTIDLVGNPITAGKYTAYNVQMSGYKKILMQDYATIDPTARKSEDAKSMFKHIRIVPIQVHFGLKREGDRKSGAALINEIVQVTTELENPSMLSQLPLAKELSSSEVLNKELIGPLQERIDLLESKQKSVRGDAYEKYSNEINLLRKNLNSLLLKSDISGTFSHIRGIVISLIGKDGIHGGLSIEDDTNPDYVSTDSLLQYQELLTIYSNLRLALEENFNDLRESTNLKDKTLLEALSKSVTLLEGNINSTLNLVEKKIHERMSELYDRLGIEDRSFKAVGSIEKYLKRLSQIDHPAFQAFSKMINLKQNEVRIHLREVEADIKERLQALEDWAKTNNKTTQEAMDLLINESTGNMHGRLKKDFWNARTKAILDNDVVWMKKNYKLREGWEELYKIRYDKFLKNLETAYAEVEGIKSASAVKREKDIAIENWVKDNNPAKSDNAWISQNGWKYITLKDEVFNDSNLSEEFKLISRNKPLLDFYEMMETYNKEFRDVLGLGQSDIPANFLPWIRKDSLDRIINNGLISFSEEFANSLVNIREYENVVGVIDPQTGNKIPSVPIYFINPLVKADGTIDYGAKTKDLAYSLYLFAEMAYSHEAMTEIEADVNALLQTVKLNQNGEIIKNDRGIATSAIDGSPLKKKGIVPNTIELFEAFRDYYLYGVRMRGKDFTSASGFSSTKTILTIKRYVSLKILGFGLIPAGAAWLAGRIALSGEASKGLYITKDNVRKSMLMMKGRESMAEYHAIGAFFEPYQDTLYHRIANKLSSKKRRRNINWMSDLFMPYRAIDANLDNLTTNAAIRNWGFDENGKLDRIDRLLKKNPEAKSIRELLSYNTATGIIIISGITDKNGKITNLEAFTKVRNLIKDIGSGIKGNMSNEDVKYADMLLAGQLIMQFKNWMPGFYLERLGKMKYNELYDIADQGRYIAFISNFAYADSKSLTNFIMGTILPNIGKVTLDLLNFGKLYKFKVNEDKMHYMYNKYLENNLMSSSDMSFESYLEIKKAQTRAMMSELRYMLIIVGVILAMGGDWDDDGRKNYTEYWVTRKLFALINRTETEVMAAYNPVEFLRLMGNPLPTSKVFADLYYMIGNTFDESRDFIFGENSKGDKTPFLYYGSQFFPGMSHLRRLIEVMEQDKQYRSR